MADSMKKDRKIYTKNEKYVSESVSFSRIVTYCSTPVYGDIADLQHFHLQAEIDTNSLIEPALHLKADLVIS